MKKVTIKEARKVLGDESAKVSDEELQDLIDNLSAIAKGALEDAARIHLKSDLGSRSRGKNNSTEL